MKLTLFCSWFAEQKQPCFLFFSQGLSTERSWTFATFASFNAYRINWKMFLVIHNIYYRFYVHCIFLCHVQCITSSSTSHVDQDTTFGESSGGWPSDLNNWNNCTPHFSLPPLVAEYISYCICKCDPFVVLAPYAAKPGCRRDRV